MKRLIITLVLLFGLSALSAQEGAAPAGEPRTDSVAASGDAATAAGERADDSGAESSAGSLWDRANTAYINGDYHAALEMYERILAGGMGSAKLYYNLANACFKEGQTGRAILFYHRALRLAPGSDDIRYNLSVAEARTKDRIEEIPAFFLTEWARAVRRTMSCTAWSVLSLAALAFALGLFLLYLLAPRLSQRKAGFYGTAVAAALFVLTTWFAAGERREMLDDSQAVVMAASTAVKSSPDKSATDLFVLHEGTLVKISDRLEGWCEITIADGKKGWLECRTIERI